MAKSTTKLPASHYEAPRRYLRELAMGETGYYTFTALQVDQEGYCYLNPDEELRTSRGRGSIRVERREDGYHVGVLSGQRWEPGFLSIERGYYPVASLTDVGERF